MVEATGLKYGSEVTPSGMTSLAEFHKHLPIGLGVIKVGGTQTEL
jgi:hypothetical protein